MITKDTGSGDPSLSNPEKGKLFLEKCAEHISEFYGEINGKTISSMLK
jgi:creatinine amidohydrolase/Fe(II)-dependent formamide hydrolase-like protein